MSDVRQLQCWQMYRVGDTLVYNLETECTYPPHPETAVTVMVQSADMVGATVSVVQNGLHSAPLSAWRELMADIVETLYS